LKGGQGRNAFYDYQQQDVGCIFAPHKAEKVSDSRGLKRKRDIFSLFL
jgi:hypothetical protein